MDQTTEETKQETLHLVPEATMQPETTTGQAQEAVTTEQPTVTTETTEETTPKLDLKTIATLGQSIPTQVMGFVCTKCGRNHPFIINYNGMPIFLFGFVDELAKKFCEEKEITQKDMMEQGCFVCHCGELVRFPSPEEFMQQQQAIEKNKKEFLAAQKKNKIEKLKKRAKKN